jgi:hypothetical protein
MLRSVRAAASQSMKWLTEYSGAHAMIVSRRKFRRRLFADGVNLHEAFAHLIEFNLMHNR